jgi:hypothetical protein
MIKPLLPWSGFSGGDLTAFNLAGGSDPIRPDAIIAVDYHGEIGQ